MGALPIAMTAHAEPVMYTWTGAGIGTQGSAKCPGYKTTIHIAVDGDKMSGRFQQEGRPEPTFETTRNAQGAIETKADIGQSNKMEVLGTINDKDQKIMPDGYCKFDARKLPKKEPDNRPRYPDHGLTLEQGGERWRDQDRTQRTGRDVLHRR